ncbi:hypothetical protein [Allohahella sp. A8]|uniref:hypothetical protein n=1 Tax=Allohahella sp. A8 TaxID=3141461 RepID=UPI003A7FF9AC
MSKDGGVFLLIATAFLLQFIHPLIAGGYVCFAGVYFVYVAGYGKIFRVLAFAISSLAVFASFKA